MNESDRRGPRPETQRRQRSRDDGPPPGQSPSMWIVLLIGIAVGAFVVAISWNRSDLGGTDRWWAIVATIVVAANVAVALPRAQQLMPTPGVLPFTILCTVVAVFACVPETDQVYPVAGVVALLVIAEMVLGRRLLLSWHAGAATLVLWAGIYGATGRQSALIGAMFAWWPVVLGPLVADLWRPVATAREVSRWVITGIGAVGALVVARTGALEATAGPAVTAVVIVGWVTLVLALVVAVLGSLPTFGGTWRRRWHRDR